VLIATNRLPLLAPGLLEGKKDSADVARLSRRIFEQARGVLLPDEDDLPAALHKVSTPDLVLSKGVESIGFVHRRLEDADIYFVANTTNQPVKARAVFRTEGTHLTWWDGFTGEESGGRCASSGNGIETGLELAPYESRIAVFSKKATGTFASPVGTEHVLTELNSGWRVSFTGLHRSIQMDTLKSWTESEATQYYSGQATYETSFELTSEQLNKSQQIVIDFGAGNSIPANAKPGPGMRTWFESPVGDAAIVYVNDKKAGFVWHPPFRVVVRRWLHPGRNKLRVVVGNTAINELAGQILPDYRLLNLHYGVRFEPQDMKNLAPLPSGLLGPVKVIGKSF
jgi:hypothetical protein